MKAVILAGGQGSRLRPLSICRPKPMIPLLGRPLLAHTLDRLLEAGVDEVLLTLGCQAEKIIRHFAAQTRPKLQFRVEKQALGTAGSVRACADFLSGEDFLVVSGDAVWDLDPRPALEAHKKAGALATLLLHPSPEPLEYGLVCTKGQGRITAFSEKPGWDRVCTDLVNTGIYILSPEILGHIPENRAYDFGGDLFPALLKQGKTLLGIESPGYWCDVGNCAAYHRCSMDALSGRIRGLGPQTGAARPGVVIREPVFLDPDVQAEPGAILGPGAVVTNGSYIAAGARVENSVVSAARLEEGACVSGAVVLGAQLDAGACLRPGSTVADQARVGAGATVQEGLRVYPGRLVPPGLLLRQDLVTELPHRAPLFSEGCLREMPDPAAALQLGMAAGTFGRLGLSWAAGSELEARTFLCGARAAGAAATALDAEFAAAAAFGAGLYALPLTAFFDRLPNPALRLFDRDGLPASRAVERKLNAALQEPSSGGEPGPERHQGGVSDIYLAAAARCALSTAPIPVAVGGAGACNRALKKALAEAGFRLCQPARGILCLGLTDGGFSLRARDENGQHVSDSQLLSLLTLFELRRSGSAAVADSAPLLLDRAAEKLGASLLRPERDGEKARRLYLDSPFQRDGLFRALRLLSHLALSGQTLAAALEQLPAAASLRRELPLRRGRAEMMRLLSEFSGDLSPNLTLREGDAAARVSPLAEKQALRLEVEAPSPEAADAYLHKLEARIRRMDSGS